MSNSCIIQIDNTNNPYPLIYQSNSTYDGTFSPALPSTIEASAPAQQFTLTPGFGQLASATLVWTTGPADAQATITMEFENGLLGVGNKADLTVTGSAEALLSYGVSYFYASSGTDKPMARDYINGLVGEPLNANFYTAFNSLAGQTSPYLPGITNVVMLMLENRSLDHLMGQLYTTDTPAIVIPANSGSEFNGLGATPTFSNTANGPTVTAFPVTGTLDVPNPDPGEGWANTNQQLFNIPSDQDPPVGATPNMGGFLANYAVQKHVTSQNQKQIMWFYTPEDLPVISTLAKSYAVSDAWFSSVPSETLPNRAFSIAGTSSGNVYNIEPAVTHFKMRTMFNLLTDCGNTDWAIFSPEFNSLYHHNPLTVALFEQVRDLLYGSHIPKGDWPFAASDSSAGQSAQNQSIDDFLYCCENGTLPAFSYIEPGFYSSPIQGINGCDYHPPANLCPGEAFLATIYSKLSQTFVNWNTALLIVTFDEHGGNFDHVPPPDTIPPDGMTNSEGFGFDRLGVRVPTLLISPTIPAGTVFRSPNSEIPFDHTSFLMTILGWLNIDISGGAMGARAALAPDFSGVIVPTPEGETPINGTVTVSPNTVCSNIEDPLKPPAAVELNGLQKFLLPLVAESITGSKSGTDDHQRVLAEMQSLNTVGELRNYVEEARTQRRKL